jgi:glycosyltransferase involved in cell wall biosynthesis
MSDPGISVVLPVYNGERYLAPALDSVLAQTRGDFELIVIDDGSTDGTPDLLAELSREDDRLRVHRQENRGLIATLNRGLTLAQADLIARMDDDDICRPERFARQGAFLDEHPECVAVGCRALMVDPDGAPIMDVHKVTEHDELMEVLMRGGGALPHPGSMFRREAANRIGGYRAEYIAAEDVDFFLRLAEIGRLANLPEVLLEYRIHLKSESRIRREQQIRNARRAVEDACERLGIDPPPPDGDAGDAGGAWNVAESHRRWALWALRAGHRKTARKHALRALLRAPFRKDNWRICRWVLRGY